MKLQERGDLLEAELCFRSALRADPAFEPARATLAALPAKLVAHGVAAQEADDLIAAERHYGAALAIDADLVAAQERLRALAQLHFAAGVELSRAGDAEGAIAAYRRAVRCGFAGIGAALSLAQLLIQRERYREAIEALHQAIEIEPQDAALWRLLAEARDASGDTAGAFDALHQARGGDRAAGPARHVAQALRRIIGDEAARTCLAGLLLRPPRQERAAADRDRLLESLAHAEATLALYRPPGAGR
jgi:tetratricopeptide (TPR) repeat protein